MLAGSTEQLDGQDLIKHGQPKYILQGEARKGQRHKCIVNPCPYM